ncbi:MAG TPA: pirin family protein [Mycobacteriales bacterium]|nr:pirin family protein [Mycobacteriales bacterium]
MGRQVVRSGSRASTRAEGLDSRHSFSYGSAYDPDNTHFGLLLACNEDRLAAGAGFPPHPHRDIEVVTWVVSGTLRHEDDAGHAGEARPGVVQRMSAGGGVRHSEHAVGGPAHYVQMWLRPATFGELPAYDTVPVGPGLTELTPLRQPDATLVAGRLPAGGRATLAPAAYLHLLVVGGALVVGGTPQVDRVVLGPGDALRQTDAGPTGVVAHTGTELLAWRMRSGLEVG